MKYPARIFVIFAFLLSPYVQAGNSAKEFFEKYVQLSDSFEPSVADLYSDNARIHTYRKYPHGLERAMELSGVQWKQLLIKAMPLAKAQNDKSIFSEVTMSNYGGGYKIKANRYSTRKCYIDTGYYMVVAPNELGQLQIIEEYSETQPQSDC